jgi:hypothetical protein
MEAAEVAGAGQHARQLVEEVDVQRGAGARAHRLRQVQAHDRVVGGRAAVGLHEAPGHGLAALLHLAQLGVAPVVVLHVHRAAEGKALPALGHEGAAFALEGIEVQVQVDGLHRAVGAVAPGQLLAAVDRVLVGVELGLDLVAHHPVGQRGLVALSRPAPGARGTGLAHGGGMGRSQRDPVGRRWQRTCLGLWGHRRARGKAGGLPVVAVGGGPPQAPAQGQRQHGAQPQKCFGLAQHLRSRVKTTGG